MHMGIPFRAIALGERSALTRIGEITGVDAGLLASGLATKEDNEFAINGELITAPFFNRTRFRYCPTCLAEDSATGTGPTESRPFGRLAWQVSFIRTCHRHGTYLAVSERNVRFDVRDDFSSIWRGLSADERDVTCPSMPTTDFERYVLARLGGAKQQTGWIDEMPLYVVGHLSETIGAASLFGKWFSSNRLTDIDWHAAGKVGFGILRSKKRFAGFLNACQDDHLQTKRNHYLGPALYGNLFRRLDEGQREDRNYDNVRDFIREHVNRTLPFGPDDMFFGRLALPRRLHSIKTASDESGMSIKLLRSHLLHAGIVTKSDLVTTPHRVFIDARRVDDMLDKIAAQDTQKATIDEKAACAMLDVGRGNWQQIASTFGLREKSHARISQRTVETFLEHLHAAANRDRELHDDLVKPATAAIMCKCQLAEVLQLVLSHKLKTVAFDKGRKGISKILVDRTEVRDALRDGRTPQHLTTLEVADLLHIDIDSLTRLGNSGVLPRVRMSRTFFYSIDAVENFNRTYASTSRISFAAGATPWTVAAVLRDADVNPALYNSERSARFYSISDLVGLYPESVIEQLRDFDGYADRPSE